MTVRKLLSLQFNPQDHLGTAFVIAGIVHPLWWLVGPAGPGDPLALWVLVGAAFAIAGVLAHTRPRVRQRDLHFGVSFLATAHLYWLFVGHPTEPFYAAAGFMIAVSSLMVISEPAMFRAYSAFVALASTIPLFVHGGGMSVFYCAGTLSVVFFSNRTFALERLRIEEDARRLIEVRAELAHERAERVRLEIELRTAQRMDALGRLAGAFAHEFNNQLMAIRIHAELMERSIPIGAPQRRDLDQIHRTTSAAADLTARLLTFSRPPREKEEPGDVAAILRQSVVTLRHLMTEHVPVAWNAPQHVCRAPIGAKQLSQVLLNLALNAKEAMLGSGELRIDVTRIPRGHALLPVEMASEMLIVLTVSDTGPGMDEETREKIFEPFFTTKADRGNSGLGLSVVYGLVRETGGHIRVTSEPGRGARFDVYWPEVTAIAPVAETAPAVIATGAKRARVLLVEDQAVLRDGLTRWLADSGYAVVACESGEEALTRANDIDVIASDVVLRGMDGIELLGRIRRKAPRLPAVLFSGHLDHLARERREIPPGVAFLEKPFAPEALVTKLDELVDAARATPVH